MEIDRNKILAGLKDKKGKPRSEHAYWLDETAKMLKRPFGQVAGLTGHLDTKAIKDLYEMAKEFKPNPTAWWWTLWKKTK